MYIAHIWIVFLFYFLIFRVIPIIADALATEAAMTLTAIDNIQYVTDRSVTSAAKVFYNLCHFSVDIIQCKYVFSLLKIRYVQGSSLSSPLTL